MASAYQKTYMQGAFASKGVLVLALNRPPVNAFHTPHWQELGQTFRQISDDPDVHCVILASALPKIFTAGLDVTESSLGSDGEEDVGRRALVLRKHIIE